jgi:aminoglycoside 3-N-acetyltransferase I
MTEHEIRLLGSEDVELLRGMLVVFGGAFGDSATYTERQPDDDYLRALLSKQDFIAIAVLCNGNVVAGLTAYILKKYEQARSEAYIYDLAVAKTHRRQGIATSLIRRMQHEAKSRGAHGVFVQADIDDEVAVALYSRLGVKKEVLHFDMGIATCLSENH